MEKGLDAAALGRATTVPPPSERRRARPRGGEVGEGRIEAERRRRERGRVGGSRSCGTLFPEDPRLVVRRGFDLVEGGSSAADFCDDLFGGLVPDEGLGVVVPVFGPDLDGIDEVGHAGEHASA